MIVVSGASGFVGRRLAVRLKTEWPAVELKCLVKPDDDNFCANGTELLFSHEIRPVCVDLITGRGLDRLQSPEILFHLAANTHTWEKDQRCNDVGTENLLRAVEPLGACNHVIFTSTVAVMDNRKRLDEPLRSDTLIDGQPLSAYGRSKLRAEKALIDRARTRGFRLSIARLCTIYGPDPKPNSFFDVLKREVAKRSVLSRLDWPGLTSFIHVNDVVECLLAIPKNPPAPGRPRIQLLVTESRTLMQVGALLYRARGIPFEPITLPETCWKLAAVSHRLCRLLRGKLPVRLYNSLWRFNVVVNPVFHCDTRATEKSFPDLKPRFLEHCMEQI